jgi:hypothetical protein
MDALWQALGFVFWLLVAGVLVWLGCMVNRKTRRGEEEHQKRREAFKLELRLPPQLLENLERLYEVPQRPHPGAVVYWTLAALTVFDLVAESLPKSVNVAKWSSVAVAGGTVLLLLLVRIERRCATEVDWDPQEAWLDKITIHLQQLWKALWHESPK